MNTNLYSRLLFPVRSHSPSPVLDWRPIGPSPFSAGSLHYFAITHTDTSLTMAHGNPRSNSAEFKIANDIHANDLFDNIVVLNKLVRSERETIRIDRDAVAAQR